MTPDILPPPAPAVDALPALRPLYKSPAILDPQAPDRACAHVANGGDLVTLAKAWGVRYSDLAAWLSHDHPDEYAAALKARAEWGREEITREITAIVGADMRTLYRDGYLLPPHEWPDDVAKAVQDYQPASETAPARVKMIDKIAALEVFGKLSGVWAEPERGKGSGPVIVQVVQYGGTAGPGGVGSESSMGSLKPPPTPLPPAAESKIPNEGSMAPESQNLNTVQQDANVSGTK